MSKLRSTVVERPTVLQLLSTARMGGAERTVLHLLHHRSVSGCSFAVGMLEPSGPLVSEVEEYGISCYRWPISPRQIVRSMLRFNRVLPSVDVIHAYGMRASLVARCLARMRGVSVLASWESMAGDRPAWFFWLERVTSPLVSHYVAKFEAGKQTLVSRAGIHPDRITVVHNGIVTEPFLNLDPADKTGNPLTITCVANLRPVKRHDRLLESYARARPVLDNEGVASRLWIVGDGPCRSDLETLARDLGLDNSVRFWGYRNDIPQLLSHTDIIALTSDFEGMPMALIEGMAAGCAPVAPEVGGIPEVIVHGKSGLLVRPDSEEYAQAFITLGRDPEARIRLGRAARKRALKRFSAETMTRRLGSLYRMLSRPRDTLLGSTSG